MLSRRILHVAFMVMSLVAVTGRESLAQFYSDGCTSCASAAPMMAAPIAHCTPVQPVYSTCYQTVPVTTYTREKQTVEVPYYETAYEDREVTVMRPVNRQREVEVPTVSYQNVTEIRTVNRDMGRWMTNYHPVPKHTPCQVDPRPGVIGWLNRTGYSMQSAFTPNYTTSRQYVPNMMVCTVPVTRQVAVPGTQRVTVNETHMVAERKVERVPIQKLAYRKEEVTVMRPQTAYRTVPIGTSMAYGPAGFGTVTAFSPYYGGTAMAYGLPIIESAPTRAALAPNPDSIGGGARRSAGAESFEEDADSASRKDGFERTRSSGAGENIRGSSHPRTFQSDDDQDPGLPPLGTSTRKPAPELTMTSRKKPAPAHPETHSATSSGWRASRVSSVRQVSSLSLSNPRVSLADSAPAAK